MNISFIILSYNDAKTLTAIISELEKVLSELFDAHEIIVTDDASSDGTHELLASLKDKYEHHTYVSNQENLNVGASFLNAVSIAKYEYIGYTDGDDQYDLSDIHTYKKYLQEFDVVTGFRKNRKDPFYRKVISSAFNQASNALYQTNLRDANSALKIFKSEKLRKLKMWDSGAFYDLEILIRLKFDHHASFKELEISHKPRVYGEATGHSKRNMINIISHLVSNKMKKYRKKSHINSLLLQTLKVYLKTMLLTSRENPK